ncbi:MAG: UDP-N-acetylmuramate dehydrogenase [Alphaproteobacteria bacterium]
MNAPASAGTEGLAADERGLRRDEPLSRHTSMRVGGPADLFFEVQTPDELAARVRFARRRGLPVFVLGGGTNLVVSDHGVRGVVLKLGRGFAGVRWTEIPGGMRIEAGGAANLKKLVLETISRGHGGLEFAEGIPGTVGGGILMNAGAFGGEISGATVAVEGVDREGEFVRLPRSALAFSYRRLALPAGFVVTAVVFEVAAGDAGAIAARAEDARAKRGRHQPVGFPNAGSIFKNPSGDFAGRLIQLVGLRGLRIGNAQVAPAHGNFILNLGGARAAEIRELMERVRETVWRRRGVWLQPEVKLVGDWGRGSWTGARPVV